MDDQEREDNPLQAGGHLKQEEIWLRLYELLKQNGYLLRPRYRTGWRPPWTKEENYFDSEEGIVTKHSDLIDATRISDGLPVILKYVPGSSPEVSIGQYLSSTNRVQDPRNHAAPLLDVVVDDQDSNNVVIVTPLLREISSPPPASVRECVDFVHQTLEGLAFLHENKVAHRDCAHRNILMDGRALFPRGWHPQAPYLYPDGTFDAEESAHNPSRTAVGGVRYYYIDFGISTRSLSQTRGLAGRERAPELSNDKLYDPYKLDVYILGMMYRRFLLEKLSGIQFLVPLIESMTQSDPSDRPSADEALKQFGDMKGQLSQYALAQRVWSSDEKPGLLRVLSDAKYRFFDFWWTQAAKPSALPPFL